MKQINPLEFAKMKSEDVESVYLRRLPWLSQYREMLSEGIRIGQTASPAIDQYFWTHLPRIVLTFRIFAEHIERHNLHNSEVLDLGACQPVAALWRFYSDKYLSRYNCKYSYTVGEGHGFLQKHEYGLFEANAMRLEFCDSPGLLLDRKYDCVLFSEIIEHIDFNPGTLLSNIRGILKDDGFLLLTTPNVASWKKIYALTNNDWGYDAPTFVRGWGHRYEYTYYQIKELLRTSGFKISMARFTDVYLDDTKGFASIIQLLGLNLLKVLTGDLRSAVKMWSRRGSGMFVIAKPVSGAMPVSESDRLVI